MQITIDELLLREAMDLASLSDERQTVEEGLKILIRIKRQEKIRNLRGNVDWSGNLDQMRRDAE